MTNINEFFSALSNDQKCFLNLPVLWAVTIDGVSEGAINEVLSEAGERWRAKVNPRGYTRGGDLLVASEVTTPDEQSSFDAFTPSTNMGGFLPGYGLNTRANFLDRKFTVNFLETQVDIGHNYFRPWMIAIGIKGLIEEGANLKGTMEVHQFSNSGELIKGFRFKKIFPIGIEGATLNYESTDFQNKSVSFACENYEQI